MRLFIALVATAALAPGCSKNRGIQRPESPSTTGQLHTDLPAPQGFDYAPERGNITDTSPTGKFRVVKQTLTGPKRDLAPTVKFYEEVFPEHGWTLEKKETAANGAVHLDFSKGIERCHVEVHGLPGGDTTAKVSVNRK